MDPPTKGAWLERGARPLLGVYALLLALALFSPSSRVQSQLVIQVAETLQRLGSPEGWTTFPRVEVLLNAGIIVPLSLLGSLVFPRLRWQDWTAYGLVGAVTVELVQGVLLPQRSASSSDIVANASGALLGAVLAAALAWLVRWRGPRRPG